MRLCLTTTACLAAASLAGQAFADQPPLTLWPDSSNNAIRQLQADVTVEATYDTNAARSDAQLAAQRGLTLADEIVEPIAHLDYRWFNGRTGAFFDGQAGYQFYDHNTLLNREHIYLQTGAKGSVGRCSGTLTGSYLRQQINLEDVPLANVAVSDVQTTGTIGVSATCPRPIGFAPMFSFNQEWGNYSAATLEQSNYRAYDAMGGISYFRPALGSLSLYVDYRETTYPSREIPTATGLSNDGYDAVSGGLRWDRHIGARLEGAASIGYMSLTPFVAGGPKFAGLTYSGEFWYNIGPRLRVHGLFDRDTLPSVLPGSTFEVDRTVRGEVTYQLQRRISFNVGGWNEHRRYGGSAVEAVNELFGDTISGGFGRVTYSMSRRLALGLDFTHERRDASQPAWNYTSDRVMLRAELSY